MNSQNANNLGGQWFLAGLMIVLVGWFIFRYLIPQSWKEWRAAGILQAFIIALYAEMYGFPLTIYILTAYFGVDIPWLHMRGHLWSSLLGFGDFGAMVEMIFGYAIMFLGIALLAAGWRQIYNARKEEKLATNGLYLYVRHPQYTGIFIAVLGQLIHWPTILTITFAPIIFFMYYKLSVKEEQNMVERFGETYSQYASTTPRFIPKWGTWRTLYSEASNSSDNNDKENNLKSDSFIE